jgi:hypothetical protein
LDDYEEGCGPVKWEIVWTISLVPLTRFLNAANDQ